MSINVPFPEEGTPAPVMRPDAEQRVNRANTLAFIEADPYVLYLRRSGREPNGSGGFKKTTPQAIPSQRMRLIPGAQGSPEREIEAGTYAQPTHTLMGRWDADVQRGDEFTDGGRTYKVVWVWEARSYQTKAELVLLRGAK